MTYFKISTSLIVLLVLSACTSNKQVQKTFKKQNIPKVASITIEKTTYVPDISGTYSLIHGAYIYKNGSLSLQNNIEASSIVIEKLDENNFGYYYVTKVEGLHSEGYFGGFTYKDGQFYQKVIDYPTTNTTLRDNIHLTSTKNSIELTVNTINAKRVIHWKKEKHLRNTNPAMFTALKEEKKAYIELFKEKLFPTQYLSMR